MRRTVVMDKTGTLTEGKFHVTEQNPVGVTAEEQLELAALAESASNHPIAQSLKDAYGKAIDAERVTDIQEIAGHGVAARVDGRQCWQAMRLIWKMPDSSRKHPTPSARQCIWQWTAYMPDISSLRMQ